MVSSTAHQYATQGVGEVCIFIIALFALSEKYCDCSIDLTVTFVLTFFSLPLRTHLQGVKVIMKTLSAGFHQPIQGILSLPLVSIISKVNLSPASPAELNTRIETIRYSLSYFNVSLFLCVCVCVSVSWQVCLSLLFLSFDGEHLSCQMNRRCNHLSIDL